ncbi:hypothetical protein RhiirB3_444496 [Rhizophagus irregularis]|nr:hypothetical protein RhiirB3_444496 [Rhizophagus irregularis]
MVSATSYPRNPLWYDLCCIIWGDSSIHSFSVRVCKDSTISELKDMVKKSKLSLSLVHSDEIRLWKVDICLEDEKLLQQYCYAKEHDQGKKMLSSTNSVNDYWSKQPKDCHIQLIVEPTLIVPSPYLRQFVVFTCLWSGVLLLCHIPDNSHYFHLRGIAVLLTAGFPTH